MRKRGWIYLYVDVILFKYYNRKVRIKRVFVRVRGVRKNVVQKKNKKTLKKMFKSNGFKSILQIGGKFYDGGVVD